MHKEFLILLLLARVILVELSSLICGILLYCRVSNDFGMLVYSVISGRSFDLLLLYAMVVSFQSELCFISFIGI